MVAAIPAYLEWGQPFIWVSLAHQHRVSTFHRCQWHRLWLPLPGPLVSGQIPRNPLLRWTHEYHLERVVWGYHGPGYLADLFRGKRILVHCDNASVVQIMNKCSSKSKSMMVLVHSLILFSMQNNFNLCLQHIPRVNNGIADALSRFNNEEFQWLVPKADLHMMPPASFVYQ